MYPSKKFSKARKGPTRLTPHFVRRLSSWLVLSTALTLGVTKVANAATYYWDADGNPVGDATTGAGLGGGGTWDTTTPAWWDGVSADVVWPNSLFDTAVFTGTSGGVTIGSSINAGSLIFNTDGYSISGGTLNLGGSATITVAADDRATIGSIIAGTAGLVKTGNGTLVLTNTANTFSGDVVIQSGAIVIDNQAELGTGTTTIGVFGVAQTGNPGYTGGALVLAGTTTSGPVTMTRDISVAGRGPGAANGTGGLVSVGFNTIAGNLTLGSGVSEGRAWSVFGNTTVTGGVNLGTGGLAFFGGSGNWIISGRVTADESTNDRFGKFNGSLASTLWLQNNTNNFTDSIRIDSGTVRVTDNGALGLNTGTQAVDFNGGTLEIRTDTPNFTTRNINFRNNTGTVFVDRAIGGSGLNQSFVFGNINNSAQAGTLAAAGRDGNSLTFNAASSNFTWPTGGNVAFSNGANGTMTLNMNITKTNDGSNARTLTVTATGETVLTGNYLQGASTGAASLVKSGVGVFFIQGTASTATGTTTINQGTLSIPNVASIPSGALLLGNATTTAGTLNYTGSGGTLANAITLNTTTANAFLNSSGTGALTVSGTITNNVAGAHTLVLGGSNTNDNTVTSVIPVNTTATQITSLQKIGAGTWLLNPTASNTFTGSTTISGGTLKLQEAAGNFDILPDAGAVIVNVDTFTQAAGGNISYIGASGQASTETVGAVTPTAGHGTISATGTGGGSAALTFAGLGTRTAGATLNFTTATGGSFVSSVAAGTNGILGGYATFNDTEFAAQVGAGGTLTALTGQLTLPTSGATSTVNYQSTATPGANISAESINSLKMSGAQTITLSGVLTITSGGILFDNSTGAATIQNDGTAANTLGASASEVIVTVNGSTPANALTVSALISGTTGAFTKAGTGKVILSGANAFTGNVNINGGTVQMSGATAQIGASQAAGTVMNVRQGATLDLNGAGAAAALYTGGPSVASIRTGTIVGAGTITNSGGGANTASALLIGNGGTTTASGLFSGLLSDGAGRLNIVKQGTGTLSLSGVNTYTGATVINSGTLSVNSLANIGTNSAIGAGDATSGATNAASLVFNGGTLQYTGSGAIFQETQTPSISINRQFTLAGSGTIDSSGTFGNNVLASGGQNHAALIWNSTADLTFAGTGTRSLTLTGTSTGDNELRAHLINNGTDAFSFTKSGAGLWILNPSSSNTFSGATTVSGGALQVAPLTAPVQGLSANSNLVLSGGVLQTSGLFNEAAGLGAGQVQLTGGGFAASTAKLTVNLSTGTINLGAGATSGSTIILSSTSALADVELQNAINLGTAARTIQVDDNATTGLDFATASGVISGGAGGTLTKTGGGTLILGNANTYVANTILNNGALVVTSIGSSGATSTSIGTNVGGGILQIGSTTNTPTLLYAGSGETVTRQISFVGSTGTETIESSGSGPLVLTNVANNATGAFTFQVRGINTDGNMITSQLTNAGTNVTTFTKSDSGVWILNPSVANTFSGNINANGGLLGLNTNGIGSAALISIVNGGIFAVGGPLTTSKSFSTTNATAVFAGANSITSNNNYIKAAGGGDTTISNNLENGAILTINGNLVDNEASARNFNFRGFGSTIWNGNFADNTGTNTIRPDVRIASNASLTLTGAADVHVGGFLIGQGTVIADKNNPFGAAAGNLILDGGVLQGTANLTAAIPNNVFLQGDPMIVSGTQGISFSGATALTNGNRILQNDITGPATLTLANINLTSDTNARTLLLQGTGNTLISGVISNGGSTNASSLTYQGTGILTIGTGVNTATGVLTANRGTIVLNTSAGGIWNAGTVLLNPTGTLTLDNSLASGGNNAAGRVNGAMTGAGGTLNIITDGTSSSTSVGALTLNAVQTNITMSGAGTNTLTFASATFANTGSSLDLSTISSLGSTNKVLITAALGANALINNVSPRIFINGGADFATYNAVNGVQAFSSYNVGNNLNTAAGTDTMDLSATTATTANRTVNAIKIDGGITVSGAAGNKLTLNAAAILNAAGNNTISINQIDFGTNTGYIQVAPSTNLTVGSGFSGFTGSGGIAKVLGGTLTFGSGARSYVTSTHNLLDGTVVLNGGADTLFPNQNVTLNTNATLNLNGGGQYIGTLSGAGALPGGAGTVTGGGALVTNGGGTFGGQINSGIALGRVGGGTLAFEMAQTYTGTTQLMGGTTTLENDATLLNTSDISLNAATLSLSNNSSLQTQNNNRIGDAIPISLRSGTVSVTGRVNTVATETFGAISALQGANGITATAAGTGTAGAVSSLDLTFASLTRSTGATVNFTGLTSSTNTLGQAGNAARIAFTTPLTTLAGGVLGAWAISNSTDYAAYNTAQGVGVVGTGGFAGYSATFAAGNITVLPTTAALVTTLPAGTTTTGMLKISDAFSNDVAFTNAGDTLNLTLGGILRSNQNNETSIGTVATRGIITSGTSELVVYNNANTTGATAMTINSLIQGAGTTFVKSGGGVLALTGNNTYGGGTYVSQGTLELRGTNTGDVVIPGGGLTITNATVTEFVTAGTNPVGQGQIAASNAVTLNQGAVLTLVGANTLASLTFNNTGGTATPTVATGGLLTLTGATPITVSSSNPSTVATISGSIDVGSGAKTINTPAIQVGGTTVTNLTPVLNISANILSPGASFTKSGNGVLQLSGANTFSGLNVTGGGILISTTSSAQSSNVITSGPLGVGPVSMASGTFLLANAAISVNNPISFASAPVFDSTATSAFTLTLNGLVTGAGMTGTPSVYVGNPFMTVALMGTLPAMTSITKTGLGTLIFNATNYTGDFNATALGNASAVSLINDGDGTGSVQTLAMGNVIFDAGIVPNITVNRGGGSLPFPAAANKKLAPASISNLGLGATITNSNGYGLVASDNITVTAGANYNVGTATASNVTQGLELSGVVTAPSGFNKIGAGTLVLSNASNSIGAPINVTQGVLSISSLANLGGANVNLNPSTGISTLRATASITGSPVIQLTNTANTRAIEVVNGATLQLNGAFDVSLATSASLAKNDLGTLILNANNPTWTGALNINQGVVLINNSALTTPAGTGTIFISPAAGVVGAALQLAGGVTVSNPLNLQNTANILNGGINFGGMLDNVSGTNTYSGGIAMPFDSTIGAQASSTLNITGLITATGTHRLQFNSEGNINITTNGETGALFQLDKYGAGTMTISVPIAGAISGSGGFQVHKGTVVLNGTATINSSGAVNLVQGGAALTLDNSGTNTATRLTGRSLTLQGGTLNFIGNNSTETDNVLLADQGASTINMTGSGTTALTFASFASNAGSTLNLTGTFGTASNFLKFTAAPALTPVTTGILNRVTVNGNEFASYSATNGVVAFTNYASATNILGTSATQTFKATTSTLNSLTGAQTLNALAINNTAAVGGLGGQTPATTLTLTSGSILANGTGGAFLNVPVVAFAGNEGIIHVASGQSLTVNSGFTGTAGMSKDLGGSLNLNAQQFVSGTTYVNGGTLKLASGVTNTLLFNNAVAVNTGGTLDLNGSSQFIAGLSSASAGGSAGVAGGVVTNSGGGQSTFTVNGNTNFAGVITGNIYLNKTGTGALNLQNQQTYTGATLITGGTVTLADLGALPNTSQPIDIRFGTLTLNDGNLYDVANRVSDTAPITMTGGAITVSGRQQAASSETFGSVTLAGGANTITTSAGGTGVNSLDVTLASLTRSDNTATIRFNATGQLGSSARLRITANPTLTNNIIGPWAIVDREWASYDTTYGIGALNGTGFAGYSGNSIFTSTGTDNVRFATSGTTTLTGNAVVGTLNFATINANTVLNLGGNTLTVQGGGILFGQSADTNDYSIINGSITSGVLNTGGDLFLTHANFGGTNRTVTLGAPIVDNGTGSVRVIFASGQNEAAGVGNTNLTGVSTYTGGTVINNGNIVIGAGGALGTGGITVNSGILTQSVAGAGIPSQALTMNGGSTVTLAGNNSLTNLTINNNGGSAPTLNPTGVLTLTGVGGIAATVSSPGTIATISGGTVDLNGNNSYPISVGAAIVNGVDVAPWQAGLNITSLIQNGGIVKSGAGLLGLSSGLSTFTGGVTINSGGLVLGASSTPNTFSGTPGVPTTVTSGPLGTGTLTMASGTTVVATTAVAVSNNVTFLGDTVFNGTNNITFNGITTLPSTWNATVTAPQMTVIIADASPSLSTDQINQFGLGTLSVGNYAGTINIGGGLILTGDGNTLGTPEQVNLGGGLNITADTAITVNRSGSAPNARNKTLQKASLTDNGSIVAVSNLNGYGLEITGATTLTGASHFSIANATASNVVPGLTLTGVVSDTGGFSLVKSGLGTLLLTNSGNTFGGAGQTIDVLNGVLAASNDGALGNAANTITLDGDGSAGTAFRATGTYSSGRTFILNQPNNAFEVTVGNVLTLTAPFSLSATNDALIKNDNGVLEIAASNSTLIGAITINAGAIRASNSTALGSGTITVAPAVGGALQLSGGVNVANPFTMLVTSTGINNGGIIESVSGTNTYSGAITQTSGAAATYGAQAGATLNLTGTYSAPGGNSITFAGAGNVNLLTSLNNGSTFNKLGSGTLTVSVAQPNLAAAQTINQFAGTIVLAGLGTLGPAGTSTGAVTVDVGSTFTLDNTTAALGGTGSNVNNRLGTTRNITFRGGNFNLIGNETTTTTETFAVPTMSRGLSVITVTAQAGAGANLVFTSSSTSVGFASAQNNSTGPTGASVLFRGTNLGQAAGNGVATIADTGSTNGFFFNGQSGANGSNTKGILPWALIDATATGSGTSFATGDGTTFTSTNLRPLAAGEYGTANTVAANQNVLLNGGVTTNVPTGLTPNSLTIDANASLTIGTGVLFNLSSGGILSRSGNTTSSISGGVINQTSGFSPLNIWTVGNLTISSTFNGGNGTANSAISFVKAGAGTLTLTTPTTVGTGLFALTGLNTSVNSLSGQTVINQGTVKLNGGTNTIQANNFLAINGGTLDLNGNTQQVLGLFTDGAVNGAGGVITSSTGTGNLIVNADNATRNFAGSIQNSVNFVRSGQNTLSLYSPQTYTGTTIINGGVTVLRDNAAISNTSSVDINYATLLLDNTGTIDLTDRLKDTAAINLRGGTLTFNGRALTASSETVGAVTLAQGNSFINSVVGGGTGLNSTDLTLTSLNRVVGGGTVNFGASSGGLIGSSSRIIIPTINGTPTSTAFAGLTNGIIGGWAVINTSDWASYVPGLGIGAMGQAGFAQYSTATTISNASAATDNIKLGTGTSTITQDTTINSLATSNVAVGTVNIAAGKKLTIGTGGVLSFTNTSWNLGAAVNQGTLTSGGPELFIYTQGSGIPTVNAVIAGTGMTLIKTGSGTVNLAATNTYDGGTTVNQGTLNVLATSTIPLAATPANGLVINGGTATMNAAGLIAAGNIVTLNGGGSVLNLFGNNTITGLVFNDVGGGASNVQVSTFSTAATAGIAGSTGVLTIGSGGITATSSNITNANIILGRTDFGASPNTINVATINANGVDVSPLAAAFQIQSIVGSTGGINKTGSGILQFNAQSHYTGPTTVVSGGIRTGVQNGGSRFSALTLNSGTSFNINGTSTTWGSLAGSGTVFNSGGANTLTVGFDNTSTTFSGQLARFNDATMTAVGLQKVGTGIMSMTSAQSFATGSTGTITVNGGTLKYVNSGAAFPGTTVSGGGTFTVNPGGILALDNTGTANVNNRLGLNATGTLNLQGGTLTINGSSTASTPTTETITTFNVTNGGGRIDLSPNAANPLTLAITTLNTANGNGALVIGGITGAASANGVANVTIATDNRIGSQGGGANGTSTMSVRHDILGDATIGGLGTGFLVKDSVTNNWRPLGTASNGSAAPGELSAALLPTTGTQNVGLSTTQTITANSVANTLTISGTGTVNSGLDAAVFGNYGPGGGLLSLTLSQAAASLTLAGATGNINVGAFGSTSTGTTPYVHVIAGGTLNVNGAFAVNGTSGILKADNGVLNLNALSYYTGATTIDGGTLRLNSGSANTIAVVPTAGAATASQINLNGLTSVLDLNGQSQEIGALTSTNPLPGNGGTVQNAGAAATLTSLGGGTFAGNISGNIAFTRAGNNTTLLTSANTYNGATIVRGGVLQLRDSGTILNTASLTLNYGTLLWDNFGLNPAGSPNLTRLSATTPVTMQGGAFNLQGAGSTDTTATLNSVTIAGGNNSINILPFINEGSTALLTINNLNRAQSNHSGVNFNGFTTNNSTGTSTTGGQGLTANGNIIVNALNFTLPSSVTTAGSSTVTVSSTQGLLVGATVTGTGIPANERVASIIDATHFTLTTGTGVTAQASTDLATSAPIVNLAMAGAVTTASSATVTVASTAGLAVGIPVTGTGLPAGEFVASIIDGTHFTVTTGTGVTAQTSTTLTANNLTNNLIGGWAVADGNTFATYLTGYGVSVMGQTTQGIVAPGFTASAVSGATVATGNYSDGNTTVSLNSGAVVANSWRLVPGANQTVTFPTTTTLTLGVGMITNAAFSSTLAATDATNTITGAGQDLYFFVNQNTVAIQPAIIGNIAVISNGPATLSLRPTFANNTYTGGTFVQNGTLNLSAGGAFTAIPGDLTITNGAVTMSTQTNQIAAASNVFINGGGSLTLGAYTTGPTQTLNSVTFTDDGGSANPTLSLGTPTTLTSTLILSSATPITATNNNPGTVPTISTGAATLTALQFSAANPVITVNAGLAETGLTISAPITQNVNMLTLTKSGAGALALSGANTFTTGLILNQGSIILGANSTPTTGTVTSGPLGTGTLTINNGTTILSDNTIRTVANAMTVNGDFTVGGRVSGNGVILNGAMNLGAAGRTITVTSPAVTATFGGVITSTAGAGVTGLTKAGAGTMTLTAASTNASLGGAGVVVAGGILKNGIANALPDGSLITVNAGAGYDLVNFGQISKQIAGGGFITNSGNATATLIVGGSAATDAVTNLNSTFSGVITDNVISVSTSHLALTKSGLGTLTLSGKNNYTGATTLNNGTLELVGSAGATLGATAITAASGTTLKITGNTSIGTAAAGTLTMNSGSTLSLLSGAINTLTLNNATVGTNLTLTTAALQFDIDGLLNTTDSIGVTQRLTLGAGTTTIALNVTAGTTLANGTYNLMSYASGSTLTGNFQFFGGGTVQQIGGGRNYTLNTTATGLQLVVSSNATPNPVYWNNTQATASWATINTPTNATNWTTDAAGTIDPLQVPGSNSIVNFTSNVATGLSNTMDADFSIAGLNFTGSGTPANSGGVTIASGASAHTLTIGGSGITVNSTTAAHTISANVALSASQFWTNNSSGAFTVSGAVNTAGNTLTVNGTGDAVLSGAVSGSGALTKNGAGTLTLSGGAANTFTGVTTVSGGTLALNKTAGVNAIIGDGVTSKVTADIQVSGGTLLWQASNQLEDTVSINMTSGTVNLNGQTETFYDLSNSGGTFITGAGANLTINDPTWSGGTNTISHDSTATFGVLNISGGTNTVEGAGAGTVGGVLNIGAGGLNFSGTASPDLTINSDAVSAGKVVLGGDVTSTVTAGTATISSGGVAANAGTLDLGGTTRTFTVGDGSAAVDMRVTAKITSAGSAGLNKAGAGTLELAAANTYTGDTNVQQGKVIVSGSLAGNVNVSSGATLASGANFSSQVQAIVAHSNAVGGGTVAPGDTGGALLTSVGQLNATSATLGDTATAGVAHLSIELGGTNDGALGGNQAASLQYDRLALTSTLTLTNANLDVSAVNGFSPASVGATFDTSVNPNVLNQNGHIFFLITGMSATATGTFANDLGASEPNALWASHVFYGADGQEYALSYTANFTANTWTGGNDVAIMAIPEPNAMSMLAGSLGVALGLQRFRRRRS